MLLAFVLVRKPRARQVVFYYGRDHGFDFPDAYSQQT